MSAIIKWMTLAALGIVVSSCTLDPVQPENIVTIKGAPEWVNKGSYFDGNKEFRRFYGVSVANPQGDLALQKSIADDRARGEVVRVLGTYLDIVANEFLAASRSDDRPSGEEDVYRRLEEAVARQVKAGVAVQIEEAITRQFKEGVSAQFKDDVTKKIKETSTHAVKEAIGYQFEYSRQIEEIIARQIREGVSRQMKNTAQAHLVNSRVIGNWRDPRTNAFWSISELELKNVKTTMSGVNDMNAEMKHYFELNAEIIFDRILADRNGMNPFSSFR